MTRQIPLTQGKVAIIDDEDFERVSAYKWCAEKGRNTYYAIARITRSNGKKVRTHMHKFILGNYESPTDHKNGDGLLNTRLNLRPCTHQQNQFNQAPQTRAGKLSQYKGVTFRLGKWESYIKINKIAKYLGRFEKETDAARAYDKAAKEFFGEFAYSNFPESI